MASKGGLTQETNTKAFKIVMSHQEEENERRKRKLSKCIVAFLCNRKRELPSDVLWPRKNKIQTKEHKQMSYRAINLV